MKRQYRYPGAKPFEINDQHIFFGRVQDIKNMLRLIELEQSIILYGKSGLGKSSLINAGIIPRIEQAGKYLPVKIRFSAYTQDKLEDKMPLSITKEQIKSKKTWLKKINTKEKDSLWYHLKNHQINDEAKGYLLIFDQFEELFTYPEEHVASFAKQLSEIIYTLIPGHFRAEIEKGFKEDKAFLSKEQMEILHTPLNLKVLIAIRSDRMSLINRLKPYLPDVLTETYEIKPLTEIQAEDAILNPAYKQGEFLSKNFDYEDLALMKILHFLTKERTQNVESFQLQILCQYIERLVINKNLEEVTSDDIGDIKSIYENYYLNQIQLIGDESVQLSARRLIEEGLIFEADERRLSLYDVQIEKLYNIDAELLGKLVDTHLIRAESSLKGGYTYELSHDTLVAPVLRAKALRVQVEREQKVIAQKQQLEIEKIKLKQEAEEERKRAEEEKMLREAAEKSEQEAVAAEKAAELARKDSESKKVRANIFLVISLVLLAIAIGAVVVAIRAQAKTEEQYEELKKSVIAREHATKALHEQQKELVETIHNLEQQKKENIAKELRIHGDSYYSIGKKDRAIVTYQAALDSLKGFEDIPIYKELENLIKGIGK